MNFWGKIKNSIYGPSYYRNINSESFSDSLKYFFLFIVLVAFLLMIFYVALAIPKIKSFLDVAPSKLLNYYPDDLEITIKDGIASTNLQDPYVFRMPNSLSGKNYENLLVLDTENQFSLENFYGQNTLCLLSQDKLACYDEDGSLKITPLKGIDFVFSEQILLSFISKIKPYFSLIYLLLIISIFLGFFLSLSSRLVYMLIFALVILAVARIKKADLNYKKSYQAGLHLMTLPIIVTSILGGVSALTKTDISIPFLFSAIFLIMAVINIGLKNNKILDIRSK